MRYLSLAFTALLSPFIFVWPSLGAGPPIVATVTTQCPGPMITITLTAQTAGFYLLPVGNPGLYVHFNPVSTAPPPGVPGIQWGTAGWTAAGNSATYTFPSPPYPTSLQLTATGNATGSFGAASRIYQFTVPNCGGPAKGMTWFKSTSNNQTGTVTVGCGSTGPNPCDAHNGDTLCTTAMPLLCIYKPTTPFQLPNGVNNSDQYNKWSGGVIATTAPVPGPATLLAANNLCKSNFGPNWRVAEFHDGWGWNFQAYGGAGTLSPRFWVDINDQRSTSTVQKATCWR